MNKVGIALEILKTLLADELASDRAMHPDRPTIYRCTNWLETGRRLGDESVEIAEGFLEALKKRGLVYELDESADQIEKGVHVR